MHAVVVESGGVCSRGDGGGCCIHYGGCGCICSSSTSNSINSIGMVCSPVLWYQSLEYHYFVPGTSH